MDVKNLNPVINKRRDKHLINNRKLNSVEECMEHAKSLQQGAHQLLAQSKSVREKSQTCAINTLIRAFFGNPSDDMAKDGAVKFVEKIAHQPVAKFNVINMIINSDDKTVDSIAQELMHKNKMDATATKNKTKKAAKKAAKKTEKVAKPKEKKAQAKKSTK